MTQVYGLNRDALGAESGVKSLRLCESSEEAIVL